MSSTTRRTSECWSPQKMPQLSSQPTLPNYAVTHWDTGWNLRFARPVGDHLLAATLYDGMIVQPKMVTSQAEPAGEALGNTVSSLK